MKHEETLNQRCPERRPTCAVVHHADIRCEFLFVRLMPVMISLKSIRTINITAGEVHLSLQLTFQDGGAYVFVAGRTVSSSATCPVTVQPSGDHQQQTLNWPDPKQIHPVLFECRLSSVRFSLPVRNAELNWTYLKVDSDV